MQAGEGGTTRSPAAEGGAPAGLKAEEYAGLRSTIEAHHRYDVGRGQCSSILAQRIRAPAATVWSVRLDLIDDGRRVLGFTIVGGEHRLRNYRSVTTVDELPAGGGGEPRTVVLESYVVDVPEGNTVDDTKLFADTIVRLNLQKLASVTEAAARSEK
ncbi:hypothetical protein MUK42_17145 [Musa troglodytarum]|uniref:Uncharacterized protein n=1 Tax=Musa troglodytarum TaxID=320322 RepID=A0A9E7HKK6_9LILI|nr:hypothetical protein MUK42_17145 [Musa troglodytarum]